MLRRLALVLVFAATTAGCPRATSGLMPYAKGFNGLPDAVRAGTEGVSAAMVRDWPAQPAHPGDHPAHPGDRPVHPAAVRQSIEMTPLISRAPASPARVRRPPPRVKDS